MRKVFYSFMLLSVLFAFSACKQDAGKLIVGTWENTETTIDKLDELSKALFDANTAYLQQQIDLYNAQMDQMEDSSKAIYEQIIAEIEAKKADLNIDTIKANIKNNYKIGTFVFGEDSTLVIRNMDGDSVTGTWSVNDEGNSLALVIQGDEISLDLADISKSKMSLVQKNNMDTLEFAITYVFEK